MCGRFVQLWLLDKSQAPWPELADKLAGITADASGRCAAVPAQTRTPALRMRNNDCGRPLWVDSAGR